MILSPATRRTKKGYHAVIQIRAIGGLQQYSDDTMFYSTVEAAFNAATVACQTMEQQFINTLKENNYTRQKRI